MAAVPLAAAVLLALMPPLRAQAIQDSRCYLMNGGAVESFFISEDTPVGSVIGTLSVNGDPSEAGDISLRLQEQGAAVGVAAGSKNLTLLRPLDREELRGPSNVYVNVRCDRRRTTDPSFVIPVSVRVWDVNDNAPAWAGAPFRARLSELTAVGARVLRVKAADADQPGPHATIVYSVLPGPNSEYLGFLNELDGVIVVKKPLDFETLRNFTVTIRAQDQGTPPLHNDTTLTVEVLDADDQNPKFTSEHYTAIIPDDAQPGTILETSPGPISAVDQDVGINAPLQYSTTGDYKHMIVVERDTGRIVVTEDLLKQLSPVTVVVKATQVDNADRYALATLAISRLPTEASVLPVRFARRQYDAAVPEDAPPGTVLATLHTDPPHHRHQSPLQFYVSDRGFLEKFAINGAGEVLLRRALDYEAADAYHYQVMVTDGLSNDTAAINITVLNVNEWEPRFRYPQYEFRVEADPDDTGDALLPVGRLDVFDGDKPDTVSLSLRGPDASMLRVNELGEVFVARAALRALNASALHVVATAVDSGSPPRQTSVPVVVHVGGRAVAGARGGSLLALFAAALALLALAGAGHVGGRAVAGARGGSLLALFAAALALLALLVCALLAYIYRTAGAGHVGGRAVAGARGGSLLALFAAALALLALLVCALLAYIYRT
ncbi:cadherin EGF LAG seven-pass G-type receptor 2 [Ostrinia furnacalis]|uniref:cadherin EGF LAG seven-pass G-type receptor 2 n=1 Tax=Ostrinia furnacalis TaxID=93504 RepID=UPI00103F0788|nr:cadherin EGF LAG seven-pass G-type receptor 2 [Ostrinia furnacalis]